MTTKQQAEDLVDLNASDEQIVRLTGCHPELAHVVRAWGRGERVEGLFAEGGWYPLERAGLKHPFMNPGNYRIAPRLIRATAELPDGRTVELEWPEPVREALEYGEEYWTERSSQPFFWVGDDFDRRKLRQGRVFRTRESALQHDRAMIKLNGGEVE